MESGIIQKYFVNQKEDVTVKCPACGRMKTLFVARLKNAQHSIKIDCPCHESFEVFLEFRKDYREKTLLIGHFRALSTPRVRAKRCIIADQSNGGLLLLTTEDVPIKKDDQVIVSYRSGRFALIETENIISVRHYDPGHCIGGAFIDTHPQRGARPLNTAASPWS